MFDDISFYFRWIRCLIRRKEIISDASAGFRGFCPCRPVRGDFYFTVNSHQNTFDIQKDESVPALWTVRAGPCGPSGPGRAAVDRPGRAGPGRAAVLQRAVRSEVMVAKFLFS